MHVCFSDTHALVKFLDEDSTAIVPVKIIKKKESRVPWLMYSNMVEQEAI